MAFHAAQKGLSRFRDLPNRLAPFPLKAILRPPAPHLVVEKALFHNGHHRMQRAFAPVALLADIQKLHVGHGVNPQGNPQGIRCPSFFTFSGIPHQGMDCSKIERSVGKDGKHGGIHILRLHLHRTKEAQEHGEAQQPSPFGGRMNPVFSPHGLTALFFSGAIAPHLPRISGAADAPTFQGLKPRKMKPAVSDKRQGADASQPGPYAAFLNELPGVKQCHPTATRDELDWKPLCASRGEWTSSRASEHFTLDGKRYIRMREVGQPGFALYPAWGMGSDPSDGSGRLGFALHEKGGGLSASAIAAKAAVPHQEHDPLR
ncbi:hypothetical protein [Desulfacinum hydrothermale]|uniref:hypothetical protein n=1 Tax=Desulfacinum hydrothermale TaxID=109258 RepID=UPI00111C177C|nr:hypothetical protein [Desulfacinum hydrothermale]